eukprot:5695377-Pyramimonas_sp.AAC.1
MGGKYQSDEGDQVGGQRAGRYTLTQRSPRCLPCFSADALTISCTLPNKQALTISLVGRLGSRLHVHPEHPARIVDEITNDPRGMQRAAQGGAAHSEARERGPFG